MFANGTLGRVISDSAEWMVFERTVGNERIVVLINLTSRGMDYRFSDAWYPEFRAARAIFWSDGASRTWKDLSNERSHIDDTVFVPAFGIVVLKQ